jgi:hypothetical protein
MATGLPGQGKQTSMSTIQPPLSIPPQAPLPGAPKPRPMHSVAGPQERKSRGRDKTRNKTKGKGESDSQTCQSSDSESSSSSASEVSLSRWAGLDGADRAQKGKGWGHGRKGVSSSEGEVSDSETGSAKFKNVLSSVRHLSLSSLTHIFQVRKCTPSQHPWKALVHKQKFLCSTQIVLCRRIHGLRFMPFVERLMSFLERACPL